MIPINYWAVVANVILAMVLGMIWYGPLFGKQWVAQMGWSTSEIEKKMKQGMGPRYAIQALGALIMSFVLAHSIYFASTVLNIHGVSAGVQCALWSWIGFVAPATIGSVLWDGKSWKLWFINAGYFLVLLVLMAVVFAVWA